MSVESAFGSTDERHVWTMLPEPRRVKIPLWTLVVIGIACGVEFMRANANAPMWEAYERFTFAIGVVATGMLAARIEERLFAMARKSASAIQVLASATVTACGAALIVIPFGYIKIVGPSVRPFITIFGLWIASAALGSIILAILDGALRTLVADFRRRLVLAVLGLIGLSFILSGAVAVATVEWILAHKDGLPKFFGIPLPALPFLDLYSASSADLTQAAMLTVAVVAFPAVFSVCAKLSETVMERIRLLAKAFEQVAQGDRSVHVEETGTAEILSLALSFNEMVDKLYLAERIERAFGQYVSPEVVDRIRAQRGSVRLPAELRIASVFFADIRGFTSLSERLAPKTVVDLLNRYLEQVVPVVEAHQGFLNKFVGDAVVVVFNGPIEQPDHAERAARCAVALQKRMAELNAQGAFKEVGKLEIGVGVATGPTFCGNIGTKRRLEYTVIGDTVNLASRMTGHARANEAWVSEATAKLLPKSIPSFSADAIKFKGKDRAVIPYCVFPASGREIGTN